MAHGPEIKSLLSFLDEHYQALKDAEDTLNPKLENHVTNVMNVKRNLEDLRKEIIKYKREEEDIDVGKKNLTEVYHAMTLAENFLFPDDYKLDKLMYKLLHTDPKNYSKLDSANPYNQTAPGTGHLAPAKVSSEIF